MSGKFPRVGGGGGGGAGPFLARSLSAVIFRWLFFILADNKTNYKSLDEFEFGKILSLTSELAALERLKNQWKMFWPL